MLSDKLKNMSTNYHMETLNVADIVSGQKVIIPKFQRGIKWTINHQKEFLSCFKKGDPIGVVLLFKKSDKYELIDGLQRLSTIRSYIKNPILYVDSADRFQNEQNLDDLVKLSFELRKMPNQKVTVLSREKTNLRRNFFLI